MGINNPRSIPEDRKRIFRIYDDFVGQPAGATTGHAFNTANTSGGTVGTVNPTAGDARIGIASLSTSTSATGRARLGTSFNGLYIDSTGIWTIESSLKIPILSDSTETFFIHMGFTNGVGASPQHGAYFYYTATATPGNWQCWCRNGIAAPTSVDTGILVTTNPTHLKIEATDTAVNFYIDSVLATTITTNLPTGALGSCAAMIQKLGSGIVARTVEVDWVELVKTFNPLRT